VSEKQVVHFHVGLCIVSTYDTFARKKKHPFEGAFFLAIMGFERPAPVRTLVQKHAGGMFLGRGRIPVQMTASRRGVASVPLRCRKVLRGLLLAAGLSD